MASRIDSSTRRAFLGGVGALTLTALLNPARALSAARPAAGAVGASVAEALAAVRANGITPGALAAAAPRIRALAGSGPHGAAAREAAGSIEALPAHGALTSLDPREALEVLRAAQSPRLRGAYERSGDAAMRETRRLGALIHQRVRANPPAVREMVDFANRHEPAYDFDPYRDGMSAAQLAGAQRVQSFVSLVERAMPEHDGHLTLFGATA